MLVELNFARKIIRIFKHGQELFFGAKFAASGFFRH